MKESALMVGDWVLFKDEYNQLKALKVREICRKNKGLYNIVAYSKEEDLTYINNADIIEPIRLTDDILKANGFVENKGSWWLRSDLFTLNIFVEGGYCASSFSEQVFINNVHTLQHALRICGLDNLADNFKITK